MTPATLSPQEIERLVIRCMQRDEEAFASVVLAYSPRLRYFVKRMIGCGDRIDDVIQDVWFAAYKQFPHLKNPKAFTSWIYSITRNKTVQNIRFENDTKVVMINIEDATIADEVEDVEFTADEAAQVHEGLAHLKPALREVLLLRFMEEMSYQEIAEVLGSNIGTIRSRLHTAKQSMAIIMRRLRNEV